MKRRRDEASTHALGLLEESLHLLRQAPPGVILSYYAGSAPFVLGVLYFWSDMSRSAFAEERLIDGAITLALLFIWMKTWQVVFAAKLRSAVAQELPPAWSARRVAGIVARQLWIQPSGLFLLPLAIAILLPAGWLIAFYQSAVAAGATADGGAGALVKRSWRLCKVDPMQNHAALLTLFLFSLFLFINIALALLSIPFLLKLLTGIETPVTLNVFTALNTTFLMIVFGLTWLCVDPIAKAFYVLRAFYADSRQTGEDLRVRLRSLAAAPALVILAALLFCIAPSGSKAQPATPAPAPAQAEQLDRAIDHVLAQREYAWRAPRVKPARPDHEPARFTFRDRIDAWARRAAQAVADIFNKIFGRRTIRAGNAQGFSFFSGAGLAYLLIAVVVIVVGVLLFFLWRTRDRRSRDQLEAAPLAAAPDLLDENIGAEQLAEDGWMNLAMEWMARGELRLALRALYLASLAHLAERNLITLARFKSNREYERELQRRSHALPELTRAFSDNVSLFDRTWYGRHDPTPDLVRHFQTNVERIQSC